MARFPSCLRSSSKTEDSIVASWSLNVPTILLRHNCRTTIGKQGTGQACLSRLDCDLSRTRRSRLHGRIRLQKNTDACWKYFQYTRSRTTHGLHCSHLTREFSTSSKSENHSWKSQEDHTSSPLRQVLFTRNRTSPADGSKQSERFMIFTYTTWSLLLFIVMYSPLLRAVAFWGSFYGFYHYARTNPQTKQHEYPSYLIFKEKVVKETWKNGWNGDHIQEQLSQYTSELWKEIKSMRNWMMCYRHNDNGSLLELLFSLLPVATLMEIAQMLMKIFQA